MIEAQEFDTEHQISQILFTPNYKDKDELIKVKIEDYRPRRFNRDIYEQANKSKEQIRTH